MNSTSSERKEETITFSVIMPVWNRAGIIGKAIESVLNQSFNDFELIIVDDGSDDAIHEAVAPYLSSSRIKFYQKPHAGVSAARNTGLRAAVGTYIAYLDSDNLWRRDFLKRMYEVVSTGKCEAAYCLAQKFIQDGKNNPSPDGVIGRAFSFRELLKGNYIDLNTFVHTKIIVDLKSGFDEELKRLNDWDLIIRVAGWGRITFIPEILVDYYYQFEKNTISLSEDLAAYSEIILKRYPMLPEPITLVHDTIEYVWDYIPDEKYKNYWRTLQGNLINRLDYRPLCRPPVLQIEPTNTCNLQCPLCPVGQKTLGRPARHMQYEEFCKIVDDVQSHAMLLVLWDWGEPFMNPELPKMIGYATEKDIRTVVSTNAHFLNNDEFIEEVLTAGLTTLIVAIDSLHADTYIQYRKKGSLSRALEGLRKVIDIKQKTASATMINLRMVVMQQNEGEINSMRRIAKQLGADVFTVKTANPGPDTESDKSFIPKKYQYRRLEYKPGTWERIPVDADCQRIWVMANISSDGSVIPCCYDYRGSMKVGNVFQESFDSIWDGKSFAELRKQILADKSKLFHCSQCLVNFKHTPQGMFAIDLRTRFVLKKLPRTIYRCLPEKAKSFLRRIKKHSAWYMRNSIIIQSGLRKVRTYLPSNSQLTSCVYPLRLPLPPDEGSGWRSYPIFNGATPDIKSLASHVSVLTGGSCPHPPHMHDEEEILVLLAGEVELILPDDRNSTTNGKVRLNPNQCVYYPSGFAHTLQTVSNSPAIYLMFKWQSNHDHPGDTLPFGFYNTTDLLCHSLEAGFHPHLLFEGQTGFLRKLRCHISTLGPGAGYKPHADPYHVAIIVIDGKVETLGRYVKPHGVIFYRAGEPHGMMNRGKTTARYIVFEFHGR